MSDSSCGDFKLAIASTKRLFRNNGENSHEEESLNGSLCFI